MIAYGNTGKPFNRQTEKLTPQLDQAKIIKIFGKPLEHMYAANWLGAPGADSVRMAPPQLVIMPESQAIREMPVYGEMFTVVNPPPLGENYEIFP